mmetsp:Transcript_15568/g.18737  ORF Transcript_15568/g.18737 Transcript_15568/m.18737 type:complete len:219 (-) Transcript_15568:161-817(-)|eukprot:CAMPEP_0197864994 /NCGR_PEP_ID=MMETSP1438-20131217/43407_1 /TAXON_ID=1461541 /ORGANISM="Pterosperma sp., Strain CCMP1384" /LENGTH=218 /DNA_ID=CAMNT_0043483387 /DNA_START=281 /DNA_END=937 /DNA_ORIENTATION=+
MTLPPTGIDVVTTRDANGGLLLNQEAEEELKHVQPSVSWVVGNDVLCEDEGSLYITTRRVVWLSNVDQAKGYCVTYLAMTMHAISRDPQAYPKPCIYTQIEDGGACDGDDDEDISITELRIVPSDASSLDEIFRALCDCAAMNFDPDAEGDHEDEGEFYYNEEEVLSGAGADDRAALLDHFDAMLQVRSDALGDALDEQMANDPANFMDDEDLEDAGS